MNRICAVIPMFNKAELTDKCVELTLKKSGVPLDIIVVDDGSEVPYKNKRVDIIRLDDNSGFTSATNHGILHAQMENYEFVLLLNNDIEPEDNFVKPLIELMDKKDGVGIASASRLHKNEEKITVENFGLDLIRGHQLTSDTDLEEEIYYVHWLPTCASLVRMEMIREIGILDKRFRNHCSDSEYCVRANLNGWNVALVPKSRVLHHWSQTTTANMINPEKDQRLFIEKLAGVQYAELMAKVPLDCVAGTHGKISFEVYQK